MHSLLAIHLSRTLKTSNCCIFAYDGDKFNIEALKVLPSTMHLQLVPFRVKMTSEVSRNARCGPIEWNRWHATLGDYSRVLRYHQSHGVPYSIKDCNRIDHLGHRQLTVS